jgi:hypothetical protein
MTETSGGTKRSVRLPVLDGLRGIAISMVMIFHFSLFGGGPANGFWSRAYLFSAGLGWAGVDLFFVLSRFLITGILYHRDHSEYLILRRVPGSGSYLAPGELAAADGAIPSPSVLRKIQLLPLRMPSATELWISKGRFQQRAPVKDLP